MIHRRHVAGLAALTLIHACGVALLFDPLSAAFDAAPLVEQDYSLHFHHLFSMREMWRADGRLWGYNPYFMAGYASGTIQDASVKLFMLLALPFGDGVRAFKLAALASAVVVPLISFFSAMNLFRASRVALIAAFLGVVYWWNSLPREMFFYGMIGFASVSYVALLALSILVRLLTPRDGPGALRETIVTSVAWALACIVIVPLHVQGLAIMAPPAIAAFLLSGGQGRRTACAIASAGVAVGLCVNSFWLIPFIAHRGDDVSAKLVEVLPVFVSSDPWALMKDYIGPGAYWTFRTSALEKVFRFALLVLGLRSLWLMRRAKEPLLVCCFAALVGFLFGLTYFGVLVPGLRGWQPMRFRVPLDLTLALLAAKNFDAAFWRDAGRRTRIAVAAISAAGLIFASTNIISTERAGTMRLRAGVPADLQPIIEWMKTSTPVDGRVLFEESGDESGFVYDGVYLSSFAAHMAGRQLIGGPANLYNDRHHYAHFYSGRLLERPIMDFTDKELSDAFDLYNIAAIVAFDPRSIERLLALKGAVRLDRRIGPFALMRIDRPLSWTLEGAARVTAGMNRIECAEVEGETLMLKYHWVKGLRGDPPVNIQPAMIGDDPIPFVRVVNPPDRFTMRIGR